MNKLSALALSAVIAAGTPYAVANAQDLNAGAEVGAEVGVDAGDVGADVDADVGADDGAVGAEVSSDADLDAGAAGVAAEGGSEPMGGQYSFDDLRAAMEGEFDLSMVTADTTIMVVATSELSAESNVTYDALLNGESAQSGMISEVQTAIEGNAEIEAAVEAEGFESSDVIAIWAESDTALVVFVDDMD